MIVIMVWAWVFCPGELVMNNGQLMPYQGQYTIENGNVQFVSKTGETLQIPASTVNFEKTEARDAELAAARPPVDTRTRSEREFDALVAETPAKEISLTSIGGAEFEDFDEPPTKGARSTSGNREFYQTRLTKLLARRASLQARISSPSQTDKDPAPTRVWLSHLYAGSKFRRANNQEDSKDYLRQKLANVNEEIRKLQQEALSHGVALTPN